jgi:hypothetical protein
MVKNEPDDGMNAVEPAQVALRDGLQRARELICEARLAMGRPHSAHAGAAIDDLHSPGSSPANMDWNAGTPAARARSLAP